MIYTPRPYQAQAIERGVEFLLDPEKKNGIEIIPTGGGKSLVIAEIVTKLDGPCLVFQPSREILIQNLSKFVAYGFNPAIYSASLNSRLVGDITLCTIGSVKSRSELFRRFKYGIVDECHVGMSAKRGMAQNFFETLDEMKLLGFTATPYRLQTDGFGGAILKFLTRTRPRIFSDVVHVVQNGDLFLDGYLAKLQYRDQIEIDERELKVNSTGADWDDESVRRHIEATRFTDKVVNVVNDLIADGRQRILVFTRFVHESKEVSERVNGVAAVVTAETPDAERDSIVNGFKAGRIAVVCNVNVLGIGFDYPELDTAVLACPTMSLARYYQQVGRFVRPHPSKDHSLIVDMVGVRKKFGRVEDLTVEQNDGKWIVANADRQLTNIYAGEQNEGDLQRASQPDSGAGILPALKWSPPVTKQGGRYRYADASGVFWGAWKRNQNQLKAAGVSVFKIGNKWVVKHKLQ